MKLVLQQDDYGCAIACIAMVTGRTYEDVKQDWRTDVSREGIVTKDILNYLGDCGFSVIYKKITHYDHKGFGRDEMLRPFAPVHLLSARHYFDSANSHLVVMDADGGIYCPGGWSQEEILNAYVIDEVIGLYKDHVQTKVKARGKNPPARKQPATKRTPAKGAAKR
jgi:hypothetical protein